jgi:hypothetical protein
MDSKTLAHAAVNDQAGWKTKEYQGKLMHVCAELRAPERNQGSDLYLIHCRCQG